MDRKYYLSYLLNKKLKNQSEKIFEGIANGRKRALDNWFQDMWVAMQLTRDTILAYLGQNGVDFEDLINILKDKRKRFEDFSEFFIINSQGQVNISTYEGQIGRIRKDLPNFNIGQQNKPFMYGPYIDEDTLKIGNCSSKFFDEVTLMFSLPFENDGKISILCGRVPNDVMSDVIQDEDTHVYKESGDNYLFMVKTNRDIQIGTAISRSRFEDNTFTGGENLKDGISTKKWGTVKIKKHTEFEIVFKDPATNELHEGVLNTIKTGQNLNSWPGYPEYRHIYVGGKGILITPPHSDEIWGMMCEGDIQEIYKFKSLNFKIPLKFGILSGSLTVLNSIVPFSNYLLWLANLVIMYALIKFDVVKSINKTVNILQEIAEGEGDLSLRVEKMSNDEIGELSRWFNKFINNQMTIIKRIGISSRDSKNSAIELSGMTESFYNNAKNIEGIVGDLVNNSVEHNQIFQNTQEKFNILSNSIVNIDDILEGVNEKTTNTSNKAKISEKNTIEVLETMLGLENSMKIAQESIIGLKKYSEEISEVVDVIEKISKQTQMLALNASIEAARSGEHGRGFAVVANEVSQLATESEKATVSISSLIKYVQEEATKTINSVKEISNQVDIGSSSVKNSVHTFKEIGGEIEDIADKVKSISELVSIQAIELNEIAKGTEQAAAKLDRDTNRSEDESLTAIHMVKEIISQTVQVDQSSKVLTHTANNLNEIVSAFKL
ncbi:methyl-accepting chemotaxis protein [Natranaerovirga pectinivora]|uniref:Methyl-accepting chemotaxis protein n=1 Tax=Natranaerovirga pectinivora TaxID=682400 RepID=A0A4R3MLU2_9FIRM|nr:methyl-accepting chemotaxis protein [Natranaerovirga pectinivora]TCT15016.1 methyl-accepting chemotaxis protein [Natranaerovirga pectinivora]